MSYVGKAVEFLYPSKGIGPLVRRKVEVDQEDNYYLSGLEDGVYKTFHKHKINGCISVVKKECAALKISFIRSPSGTLSIYLGGEALPPIDKSHPSYAGIVEALKQNNADKLRELVNVAKAIESYVNGKVTVKDGCVSYNGREVHHVVVDRILAFMSEGLPFEPLVKFLEKLFSNPSYSAVQSLYNFLEHRGFAICPDGDFLGYKRVKDDWTDFYSGKISYKVGESPSVERNLVDDNWEKECSNGLHVGTVDYVRGFNTGGHVILCKVNPADVVSVPEDGAAQKIRVCKLYVQEEIKSCEALKETLYCPTNSEYCDELDEDDDWDDEDEYGWNDEEE